MKVMRMASGRGQSHFNITDFLQPFYGDMNLVRYPFKINGTSQYYPEEKFEARDKMSFLPSCIYSSKNPLIGSRCKLFEPVLTDIGVCYAFNAEPTLRMLKNSSFTEAFLEAYRYDLLDSSSHDRYIEGAGKVINPKYYKQLKEGAQQSCLGIKNGLTCARLVFTKT